MHGCPWMYVLSVVFLVSWNRVVDIIPFRKSFVAFNFILENEDYDRKYYTGYLGPVNLEKDESANLFVNLRCFKYSSSEAQIFVGGGITASSDAKKEWEETQFKSRTILDVL